MARGAANTAANAATTAGNVAANYGAGAATISSSLVPYLTQQLTSPAGMSQQDINATMTSGLAGAGGATAGLTGAASKNAAVTRNPMGFSGALDAAARARTQAAAGLGENVAAQNAKIKLGQQQQASQGLQSLYGIDTSRQLGAMGQIAPDVNAQVNAGKSGWLQNLEGIMQTIKG